MLVPSCYSEGRVIIPKDHEGHFSGKKQKQKTNKQTDKQTKKNQ